MAVVYRAATAGSGRQPAQSSPVPSRPPRPSSQQRSHSPARPSSWRAEGCRRLPVGGRQKPLPTTVGMTVLVAEVLEIMSSAGWIGAWRWPTMSGRTRPGSGLVAERAGDFRAFLARRPAHRDAPPAPAEYARWPHIPGPTTLPPASATMSGPRSARLQATGSFRQAV